MKNKNTTSLNFSNLEMLGVAAFVGGEMISEALKSANQTKGLKKENYQIDDNVSADLELN